MRRYLELCCLLLVGTGFMLVFYGKVLLHPNDFMFSIGGDAIKNYYTYAGHIAHDSTLVEFEGMNYPYGENFLYTDCHPALAGLFQALSKPFPSIARNSIGIVNFLMLFGIFLTFPICFGLLRELGNERWTSAVFAAVMTLLAPQLFRLGGHLSLSYSAAIPLTWWLLLRTMKGGKGAAIGLLASSVFWMFIHAYLGLIVAAFVGSTLMAQIVTERNFKEQKWTYVRGLLGVAGAVLFFYVFAKVSDAHPGRTDNPSGFLDFFAEPDDLLIPHHGQLNQWLQALTGGKISLKWEAWCYLGAVTILTGLFVGIRVVIGAVRKKGRSTLKKWFPNTSANYGLIGGFACLAFAMGFPFKWFPELIEYVPVVKQFRAAARFSWPFYFAAMAFTAVHFNQLYLRYKDKGKSTTAIVLIALLAGIYVWEGIPYHQHYSEVVAAHPNLFDREQVSEDWQQAVASVNPADYQAIVALPFYHYGSEAFRRPRQDHAVRASIVLGYHTGLPNFGAALTRISVPESRNIIQLMSPPFYHKAIQDTLPGKKPFLLMRVEGELTTHEQYLLDRAQLVYDGSEVDLYSLPYKAVFESNAAEIHARYSAIDSTLHTVNGFQCTDSSAWVYYNNFDERTSDKQYRGKAAFQGLKKGRNILAVFEPGTFRADSSYHIRLWLHNAEPDALNKWFKVQVETFNEAGQPVDYRPFFPETAETIDGDWSLVEGTFALPDASRPVRIVTEGWPSSTAKMYADELLIYSAGTAVYRLNRSDNTLFFNGHWVPLP